jgi:hypothetical protein
MYIYLKGNQFGETFIRLQFSLIMSILQQYSNFTMNNKNYIILCNHLSLLEKVFNFFFFLILIYFISNLIIVLKLVNDINARF